MTVQAEKEALRTKVQPMSCLSTRGLIPADEEDVTRRVVVCSAPSFTVCAAKDQNMT